jgi:uncharacterized protein (DUF1778 family)
MAKTAPINMRVEPSQQDLLTRAARALNVDRTTFILEAACREAENVLLDRRFFQLDEDTFTAFEEALVAPPPDVSALKQLLEESPPWDE